MVLFGLYVWKQNKPDLIPGYKKKPGENTALYCEMVGKATIFFGIGLIILSIPLPLENPSKLFAVSCLVCCLVFVGIGLSLFCRAQKR
jgi:hypothetical protein